MEKYSICVNGKRAEIPKQIYFALMQECNNQGNRLITGDRTFSLSGDGGFCFSESILGVNIWKCIRDSFSWTRPDMEWINRFDENVMLKFIYKQPKEKLPDKKTIVSRVLELFIPKLFRNKKEQMVSLENIHARFVTHLSLLTPGMDYVVEYKNGSLYTATYISHKKGFGDLDEFIYYFYSKPLSK